MDSEHRHELAENDLARILKDFGTKFEGYGGPIVAGCIALVAIVIGYSVVQGQSAATSKEAWKKLASATIPENFETVAEEYPDTEISAWARVNQGRMSLQEGIREAFQDRESSQRALTDAKTAYEAALENPASPDEVREKALFGLATYQEAISTGDTAAAIAAYQRLVDEFPNGGSRKYAEQRIETLQTESAKEFYAWFSEQDLKREIGGAPNDILGTNSPFSTPPTADDTTDDDATDNDATAEAGPDMKSDSDEPLGENPFEDLKSDDADGEMMKDGDTAAEDSVAPKADTPAEESAEAKPEMKESADSESSAAPKLPAPEAEAAATEAVKEAAAETTEASAADAAE